MLVFIEAEIYNDIFGFVGLWEKLVEEGFAGFGKDFFLIDLFLELPSPFSVSLGEGDESEALI